MVYGTLINICFIIHVLKRTILFISTLFLVLLGFVIVSENAVAQKYDSAIIQFMNNVELKDIQCNDGSVLVMRASAILPSCIPSGMVSDLGWEAYDRNDNDYTKDYTQSTIDIVTEDLEVSVLEAVHTSSNGDKSIKYSKLTLILIEATKEQQIMIEELKNIICSSHSKETLCKEDN